VNVLRRLAKTGGSSGREDNLPPWDSGRKFWYWIDFISWGQDISGEPVYNTMIIVNYYQE
jgi:hypothetical protein